MLNQTGVLNFSGSEIIIVITSFNTYKMKNFPEGFEPLTFSLPNISPESLNCTGSFKIYPADEMTLQTYLQENSIMTLTYNFQKYKVIVTKSIMLYEYTFHNANY